VGGPSYRIKSIAHNGVKARILGGGRGWGCLGGCVGRRGEEGVGRELLRGRSCGGGGGGGGGN